MDLHTQKCKNTYIHYSLHAPYQQVGQQDGHDDEEDDPENVGHYWEGGQQETAFDVVAKNAVILKLANGHHHGLDEGEAGISER